VTTLAVTDHDTTAATHEVAAAARRLGIDAVPGIEVTAVQGERVRTRVLVGGPFVEHQQWPLLKLRHNQRQPPALTA